MCDVVVLSPSVTSIASGVAFFMALFADIVGEQGRLAGQDHQHSLVDTVFGEQAVDLNRSDLAHAVAPSDRLVLGARLPLWLGQDDDRRGLDVEPDAAGFDLADEYSGLAAGGELGRPSSGGRSPRRCR